MFDKLIFSLFFALPFFGLAQASPGWQLYLNKTKLLSASVDSVTFFQLSKRSKGILHISFQTRDTSFKRTLLIMNKQRNTLLRKEMKPACKIASFSVADLLSKTSGHLFAFYMADVPADRAKAMLIRVAPVPICKVEWKE